MDAKAAIAVEELVVPGPVALRAWLEGNHATSPGVLLVLGKAGGSVTDGTWESAVEELLCFGWIGSVAGRRDEQTYPVRITRAEADGRCERAHAVPAR